MKILTAYFSHSGMNYWNGDIIELKKGNTEKVAEIIAKEAPSDLFEISPKEKYPFDYKECVAKSRDEIALGLRPEIEKDVDVSAYDIIFVGYPIWCGTAPMPVFTFLEGKDFHGKTVVPFCTHEGSGLKNSVEDIKKACPGANVTGAFAIKGCEVSLSEKTIGDFVKNACASCTKKLD